MTLDELKPLWQEYDRKIKNSSSVSEKLISSMISERSGQRFARFKKDIIFFLLLMIVWIVCFSAVIIGNPFDFLYAGAVHSVCIAPKLVCCYTRQASSTAYKLFRTNFNDPDLERSLQNLVRMYEKYGKTPSWVIFLMISAGLLFSFSFFACQNHYKRSMDCSRRIVTGIGNSLSYLFCSLQMGAFKDRYEDKFRNDLYELEELKRYDTRVGIEEYTQNVFPGNCVQAVTGKTYLYFLSSGFFYCCFCQNLRHGFTNVRRDCQQPKFHILSLFSFWLRQYHPLPTIAPA